jgi:hypothetical protein
MPLTTPLALAELPLAVVLALVVPVDELRLLLNELPVPPLLLLLPALLVEVGVGLGERVTVKRAALVAVPSGLVTVIGPLPAPAGTIAVTFVSFATLKNAARPAKPTALTPPRSVPVNVTVLPTAPEVGAKPVSAGVAAAVGVGVGVPSPRAAP